MYDQLSVDGFVCVCRMNFDASTNSSNEYMLDQLTF